MPIGNAQELEAQLAGPVREFGLAGEEVRWELLMQLLSLWRRYGRVFNLSGSIEDGGLLRQIVEGLQVVALVRQLGWSPGQTWLDVGAGGGFPGLIVAANLELRLTLVEPRERRAAFLDLALHAIGRSDCRVLRGRIGVRGWEQVRAGDTLEAGFDWASARAVFALEEWLRLARGWVRPGGIAVAHLHAGSMLAGSVGRVDGSGWSVQGIRVAEGST